MRSEVSLTAGRRCLRGGLTIVVGTCFGVAVLAAVGAPRSTLLAVILPALLAAGFVWRSVWRGAARACERKGALR